MERYLESETLNPGKTFQPDILGAVLQAVLQAPVVAIIQDL